MSQYNYVKEDVEIDKLVRGPKGLRLEAKVAYRDGHAMLSVYGFWGTQVTTRAMNGGSPIRVVLQRVFVPSNMSKADKRNTLRAMCDLFAVQHGESYYLRSKLQ